VLVVKDMESICRLRVVVFDVVCVLLVAWLEAPAGLADIRLIASDRQTG
jgi:hypothetical protein